MVRTLGTASDKDLQVVEPTPLDGLLARMPQLEAVVTTGEKATGLFTAHFGIPAPRVGTWVERKADYYRAMLCDIYDDIH